MDNRAEALEPLGDLGFGHTHLADVVAQAGVDPGERLGMEAAPPLHDGDRAIEFFVVNGRYRRLSILGDSEAEVPQIDAAAVDLLLRVREVRHARAHSTPGSRGAAGGT